MITIFNRKELIITMDMNRQSEIRSILASNDIDYIVKTKNLQNAHINGNRRIRTGSLGIHEECSYEYRIFVHKRDYEKAKHSIE